MTMGSMITQHFISFLESITHTDCHRLLSNIKMHETHNFILQIKLSNLLLYSTNKNHFFVCF